MEEIRNTIFLIVLIISIVYMLQQRRRVLAGQVIEEPLTRKEKVLMWVLCLFNPIIAGAVFYYGWIKKLPVKARQANRISIIAFFISLIVVGSIMATLFYYSGKQAAENEKQFKRAVALIHEQKFDEAQAVLIELNKKGESVSVHHNLAVIYRNQGNFVAAVAELNRALELEPNNSKVKEFLEDVQTRLEIQQAVELARQGKTAEAKIKLLQIDIKSQQTQLQSAYAVTLAEVYMIEGNREAVIQQLEAALKIDPNDKEVRDLLNRARNE